MTMRKFKIRINEELCKKNKLTYLLITTIYIMLTYYGAHLRCAFSMYSRVKQSFVTLKSAFVRTKIISPYNVLFQTKQGLHEH